MRRLKVFAAFAGYGSQEIALKRYGVDFEHVGISEIDKYAIQAHETLHGKVKNYGDVSKISVEELPDMDLFTYSFPCQDISNAGKQKGLEKGSGTRSSLLWECERIIESKRPMFLMMENVKNLVGKKNKPNFDKWLEVLESLGYNNYWKVINAKWCGVPQNRERVFCVSIRKDVDNGLFNFYKDFDNGIRLKDILKNEVEEKYYLSDEKTKGLIERIKEKDTHQLNTIGNTNPSGKGMNGTVYHSDNLATTITTMVGGNRQPKVLEEDKFTRVVTIEDLRTGKKVVEHYPSKLDVNYIWTVGNWSCDCNRAITLGYEDESYQNCSEGRILVKITSGSRIILDETEMLGCAIRGRNLKNPKSRISGLPTEQMLEINRNPGVSNCLTTVQKDAMVLENQYRIRKLTPYECFLLMGLTHEEATKLVNSGISNSQLYKMAGNSIVVDCMKFLKKLYAIFILNEGKPDVQLTLF